MPTLLRDCAIFALNVSPQKWNPMLKNDDTNNSGQTNVRQRRETNHPRRGGDSKWRNYHQINFFHFGQRKSVLGGGGGRRGTRKCVETNILLKGVFDACSM